MEDQVGFQEQARSVEELMKSVEEYGKTSFDLLRLQAAQKGSVIMSNMLVGVSILIPALMCIMALNIAAAFWLGELLGKVYFGFLVVAGFYFVVGLFLFLTRHHLIEKPVLKMILSQILK